MLKIVPKRRCSRFRQARMFAGSITTHVPWSGSAPRLGYAPHSRRVQPLVWRLCAGGSLLLSLPPCLLVVPSPLLPSARLPQSTLLKEVIQPSLPGRLPRPASGRGDGTGVEVLGVGSGVEQTKGERDKRKQRTSWEQEGRTRFGSASPCDGDSPLTSLLSCGGGRPPLTHPHSLPALPSHGRWVEYWRWEVLDGRPVSGG